MPGAGGNDLPGAVLFACTMNSVRSPMAAAILRHLGSLSIDSYAAEAELWVNGAIVGRLPLAPIRVAAGDGDGGRVCHLSVCSPL